MRLKSLGSMGLPTATASSSWLIHIPYTLCMYIHISVVCMSRTYVHIMFFRLEREDITHKVYIAEGNALIKTDNTNSELWIK
jgi:hypothetical protein